MSMSLKYEPASEPLHMPVHPLAICHVRRARNLLSLSRLSLSRSLARSLSRSLSPRKGGGLTAFSRTPAPVRARDGEFFMDNLLVRIHFIIVMISWTGLAPWEFEFPCACNLVTRTATRRCCCLQGYLAHKKPPPPRNLQ